MKTHYFLFFLPILLFPSFTFGQSTSQTIRGTVIDKQSQQSIPGVLVELLNTEPKKQVLTDGDGKFTIAEVIPGRYEIRASFSGYKMIVLSNVIVTSGKEIILDIALEESVTDMEEVVVTSRKNTMNNDLTTVSGRSFSMEEVNRYAGGRSDPARLASNFAGVSSPDDSRNDIVIRGNSPVGVLWRIEGLNVPNPNHFSTIGTTGGPISAINTNLLRNSDFMTSAFPAEYGNANAGVFDLGMRNGNTSKREHTFQFGALTGLELVTEGPIKKENNSSYLVGYRYGFSSVAQSIGLPIGTAATPYYQDFSFKINTGVSKLGKFTFFGIGALSSIDFLHSEIDSTDLFADATKDSYFTSQIALFGVKHYKRINDKSYFITVIGGNYAGSNYLQDSISPDNTPARTIENKTQRLNYSLNTSYNSKISARLFLKAGFISEIMNIRLNYRDREDSPNWIQYWNTQEITNLMQAYVHTKFNFTDKFTMNLGVHSQFLTLNKSVVVEPRLGLKYQLNKSNFTLGYGMHSQMQPLDAYFLQSTDSSGNNQLLNKNMGFTKAQHFVLGYEITPFQSWRFKTEVYYQFLNKVPVERMPSSYSMLNAGASFFPNNRTNLVNAGAGENYGIEGTIEKYFSKGYYGLITGSVYQAKYRASDEIWRNTAFSGQFVYNVLVGKEFKVGAAKRNAITVDIKFTHAGGRFYTPVDFELSQLYQQQVLKSDEFAFSEKYADFMRLDVKFGFTLNGKKRKISQSWSFDINNVTNRKNVFIERYNPTTNSINTSYQIGFFPNFVYKIQF